MSANRLSAIADQLVAARRAGARVVLADAPKDFDEGAAVQDLVAARLGWPTIGWKVIEMPDGRVIFAPLLAKATVPEGGTWKVVGDQPAGIELEIAFVMARDVPAGATGAEVLDAIGAAHVVYELCQSRVAEPDKQPRHVAVADCILNENIVVGPTFTGWRERDLKAVPGRLLVDGKVHVEGKSVDPIRAIQVLAPALAKAGKTLAAGQIVITGSLIGMNWLTGKHDLVGIIDGCGETRMRLEAA